MRKIILINWDTLEILEKGVLSKEAPILDHIALYATLNKALKDEGIPKVWLVEPIK